MLKDAAGKKNLEEQVDFRRLFMKSKGQPILYKEKTLIMDGRFDVVKNEELLVTIESTNSKYIQAVGISEEVEVFEQRRK